MPKPQTIAALATYAYTNGRNWKRKLSDAWLTNQNLGPILNQARNTIGPSGLYNPNLNHLLSDHIRHSQALRLTTSTRHHT